MGSVLGVIVRVPPSVAFSCSSVIAFARPLTPRSIPGARIDSSAVSSLLSSLRPSLAPAVPGALQASSSSSSSPSESVADGQQHNPSSWYFAPHTKQTSPLFSSSSSSFPSPSLSRSHSLTDASSQSALIEARISFVSLFVMFVFLFLIIFNSPFLFID